MFPRDFRTPEQGKIKIFLNLSGKRWAKGEYLQGFSGCVPRWLLGLISGTLGSAGGLALS